jgi:serine/threonine-protein kinase
MESEVQVGQLIAGKYRMLQVLGRGGMGVVMAALHEHLNQRVALKFLTDNAFQQPEAITRFVREARAAVQIQSEHVARVMDVGTLDSGAPYMVMECLRGQDLKEVSSRRGALPISDAVDFVLQACDAVAEAHSLGIIHRDLKPSNLFLTERPDGSPLVKVLDFGISKALHSTEASQLQMTASAAIMGSPQYMSPEQIRSSKNVDARADVWALGTILHELLTGAPAYVADTVPGLLAMIVADPPPPLTRCRADAPRELEAAILRCLEKDRERRFANVSEFARAIERFASLETRPLVKRIARVLGDHGAPAPQLAAPTPFGATLVEPVVGQTNGTWARTGQHHDAGAGKPAYRRPSVQWAAGAGALGIGVASWFLFIRSAPNDMDPYEDASPAARTIAPTSEAAAAQAPPAVQAPAAQTPAPQPGPAIGVVRPILDEVAPPAGANEAQVSKREASNREADSMRGDPDEEATPAPKTRKAAASRQPRARSSSPKAPRSAPSAARAAEEPAPAASAPPAKKSSTLDSLFNDTK